AGDVFFAVRGVRQDGHAFIGHARARGAGAAVVTHLPPDLILPADFPVILVDDTTRALQRLAAFHWRRRPIRVVGITGSNGETTIAPAHLEGVGSIEGVQKAKGELVEAIPPDGVVVLNADDPLVAALGARAHARVVTCGQARTADVRLHDVAVTASGLAFTLSAGGTWTPARLPLAGRHNAWNAAAAVAVGMSLGVPLRDAARALAQAAPVKGRLVWRRAGGVRIL